MINFRSFWGIFEINYEGNSEEKSKIGSLAQVVVWKPSFVGAESPFYIPVQSGKNELKVLLSFKLWKLNNYVLIPKIIRRPQIH